MVDPIGNKAGVVALRRIAPVSAPAAVEAAKPAQVEGLLHSSAAALSRDLAAAPPVDAARVAELRQAIQDGSYTLDPPTTADRLLGWSGK
jgi:negative regulator of flagellin synthesis FlgM